MDTPNRPELSTSDDVVVDPIGPPVLQALPRYLVRSLALTGVAVVGPALHVILQTSTGTPTTKWL
ncbi:hypothetical protein [Kribbella monticola]|uniref:hypothetical protein n=1 Tax=Kribbella monticola TaxID=2185285 RepID=UPI000DD3001A|nr:hypothetical protein [Kribbella monticola]